MVLTAFLLGAVLADAGTREERKVLFDYLLDVAKDLPRKSHLFPGATYRETLDLELERRNGERYRVSLTRDNFETYYEELLARAYRRLGIE